MLTLDSKDKKILYYLILNSRQSFKSLGKKVGASKEFVSYRIKRLIDKKIITEFTIRLDPDKLGYTVMQTHYKFTNINPKIKEEIINFFVENKHTFYVSLIDGIYDLQVEFYLGNPFEFEKLLDHVREKYSNYLIFKLLKPCIGAEFYDYSFLLGKNAKKKLLVKWRWGQNLQQIDELDFNILKELSNNARIPTKEIANKLDSTVSTVSNRVKRMKEREIFGRQIINVDWSKLGYRWFHLQIGLRDYSKKNKIINYMRENPYLIRRFKFLNLDLDLHFALLLKDLQQLRDIIEDMSTEFPNSINDYHFYSTFKVYKYNFMIPEILKNKDPLNRGHVF
jgi:DNA-binding Lrp family transcriptional regulator